MQYVIYLFRVFFFFFFERGSYFLLKYQWLLYEFCFLLFFYLEVVDIQMDGDHVKGKKRGFWSQIMIFQAQLKPEPKIRHVRLVVSFSTDLFWHTPSGICFCWLHLHKVYNYSSFCSSFTWFRYFRKCIMDMITSVRLDCWMLNIVLLLSFFNYWWGICHIMALVHE